MFAEARPYSREVPLIGVPIAGTMAVSLLCLLANRMVFREGRFITSEDSPGSLAWSHLEN
jgi:hypothetical protein